MTLNRIQVYKICILGEAGVGKSCFTKSFIMNYFTENYDPTDSDDYRKQVVIDDQVCMVEILDTPGQEEYTALRECFIRDSEAFIIAFSISSRPSLQRVEAYHSQILRVKAQLREERESQHPVFAAGGPRSASVRSVEAAGPNLKDSTRPVVMLMGCKSDLIANRQVPYEEGAALARTLECPYIETSARAQTNINEAVLGLVRLMRSELVELKDIWLKGGKGKTKKMERMPSASLDRQGPAPPSRLQRLAARLLRR